MVLGLRDGNDSGGYKALRNGRVCVCVCLCVCASVLCLLSSTEAQQNSSKVNLFILKTNNLHQK